ncbi:probable D-2-hydroxyglutarate dehydrogenase, mitochondrial [Coccomyxa sp. Obi]|nr:probable D-2-hydroxyglutarate dehydrogenase, mitochondrial [Coccomyxa sp. Obi]
MLVRTISRNIARASGLHGLWAVRHGSSIPQVRDPSYARVEDEDISFFRGVLGDTGVITDSTALQALNQDWMGKYEGKSTVGLQPKSTEQVSKILAHCNARRLAVVPQGGNTGLVGGSVPLYDEIVLTTTNMNRILSFDEVSGTLVCEAGCILEELDRHVGAHGFTMPLDLGAKGSCHIGGNVSTNAGGLRLLRYGSLHGTVLGVEAVVADGTVVDMLQTLRKDNTGYDLKQLFIGAEGTLGVVTAVSILCPPRPSAVHVSYLAVPDFATIQKVFVRARQKLGEILSAFEFLDQQSLELTLEHLEGIRNPLPDTQTPFYLVVETSGSNEAHDYAKIEAFLEEVMEEGWVLDGTIAQDSTQTAAIWGLREGISVALKHAGAVYKYDLSMPVADMYSLVEETRERLAGLPVEVVGYGHLGDGNLHLNISTKKYDENILRHIEPFVYEWTAERRGSISAEHGLGQMKADCIGYTKSPEAVKLMGQIKRVFDPNGILNPYKVLPQSVSADNADALAA